MKKFWTYVFVSLLTFSTLATPFTAFADSANIGGYGNTVEMVESEEIQMVDEQIKMFVTEKEITIPGKDESVEITFNQPLTEIEVSYTFLNTTDEDVDVTMGFPEKNMTGIDEEIEGINDYKLNDFVAEYEDGTEIEVTYEKGEVEDFVQTNWYIYEVPFEANEEIVIKNSYWIYNSSYKTGNWFYYILETGASWKDVIEEVDIEVSFMEGLSVDDVLTITPEGYEMNEEDNTITWSLTDIEPTEDDNIEIRYNPDGEEEVEESDALFPDIEEHLFQEAIEYLKELGVVDGYPDGTFRPNVKINRAELTKILVEGLDKTVGGDPYDYEETFLDWFPDVPEDEWYYDYVKAAANNGWINGYPDGTFAPAEPVNRVEAIKMILLSQGIEVPEVEDTTTPFEDAEEDQWYIKYVKKALEIEMIYANSNFLSPGEEISRGEVCQLLYNVLISLENGS